MKKNKLLIPFISLASLALSSCSFFNNLLSEDNSNKKEEKDDSGSTPTVDLERIDVKSNFNENSIVTNRGEESGSLKSKFLNNSVKSSTSNYDKNAYYEKKIPLPSHKVSSPDQFADALDYHAFYYDDKTFGIKLNSDYPSPDIQVINDAFFKSKLCAGVVGLNYSYDERYREYSIQMLFNENANQYTIRQSLAVEKISLPFSYPSASRDAYFNDFPYLSNKKGEIDVYNSEQVLYALENNYIPIPMEDSPAEVLINRCKDILRKIIKQNMSDLDKITAIYSYIIANNIYDRSGDEAAAYVVDEEKYPDFVASNFRSFFAEGCLIDGQSVCHGFAKGFNILANMEGLTSIKVTSRYKDANKNSLSSNVYSKDDPTIAGTYSNHGYSYVLNKTDKKYYIVDPTYAYNARFLYNEKYYNYFRRSAIMKSFSDWSQIYSKVDDKYHDTIGMGQTSLDISDSFKIGENLTATIDTLDDLQSYVNSLTSFMSSFSDLNYKTNSTLYMVYLTVRNIDSNPDVIMDTSEEINNRIETVQNNSNGKLVDYSLGFYFLYDTGISLFFSF